VTRGRAGLVSLVARRFDVVAEAALTDVVHLEVGQSL